MVTQVNTLVDDTGNRFGYPVLMGMIYPNRLGELMRSGRWTDPALGSEVGTTKQQIFKLRTGKRKLTREWAERLAGPLGVTWPEVMGWTGMTAGAAPPTRDDVLRSMGARIAWARSYRGLSVDDAAARFQMAPARLVEIEDGAVELGAIELGTISAKLQIEADFILRGEDEALPWRVAEDYRAYRAQQSPSPSTDMEHGKDRPRPQRRAQ